MTLKKILIFALVIAITACSPEGEVQPFKEQVDSSFTDKKVVMIILDSMMGSSLDKSLEEGDVPALQFLIDHGHYDQQVVSPFPSMSVTIKSTLLTGKMADEHRIPGLSWYDPQEDRIVNYGSTFKMWMKNGFSQGVYDTLFQLNNEHLSPDVSTIFEDLDEQGLTSGSVNALVYRGNQDHQLSLPELTDELTDLPETIKTKGPNVLAFGRLAKPAIIQDANFTDGVFNRLGLQDQYSMEVTQKLIEQDHQPDFLMVFLPENDKETHDHSPHYRKGLEQADQYIQGILSAYDSWEAALEENIFIVLGDHGQDKLVKGEDHLAIDLNELYADFAIPDLAEPVSHGEVAFGVSQRMAYIYDVHEADILSVLAERAMQDERIDLAAWREDDWVHVVSPDHEGYVRFQSDVDGEWTDRYDQTWSIEGNKDILTLDPDSDQQHISYVDYPDVLHQLETAIQSHDVDNLILEAKPGHSFKAESIAIHPDGGEHGGLHKNDTLVAMVIAGTDQKPMNSRIVDLKEYVLRLLTTSPEPINKGGGVKDQSQGQKGRSQNQSKSQAQSQASPRLHPTVAKNAKQMATSMDGVTGAEAVAIDQDLFVTLEAEHWHRFRLKSLRQQTFDSLSGRFPNYTIRVSTDWKIHRELTHLSDDIQQQKVKPQQIQKRVQKLDKDMKG